MTDEVTLTVGNTSISGWQAVRVSRGIERMPADFDISLTERYPGVDQVSIKAGDSCVLSIGSDVVLTGYVDRTVRSVDPRQHPITISGRGMCQDLVDCSAQISSFMFQNMTTAAIAAALAEPFGIGVSAQSTGMVHPQVCLNVGETPFMVIDRLCKLANLLCYENESGNLVLASVSTGDPGKGFQLGTNVERMTYVQDVSQRFSKYRVYPIGTALFTDAGQLPQAEFEVSDSLMTRYRPKAFIALNGDPGASVSNAHAQWECNRRIGRGNVITTTVDSWRDENGQLYTPNTRVMVDADDLKVQAGQAWLISAVSMHRGPDGTHADITLMPPDAFAPEPITYLPVAADVAAGLSS
jgi:prophage tail gpP-like protein